MYGALRDEMRWVLPEVLAFQANARPDDAFVIWSATGETSPTPKLRARPIR